MWNKIDHDIRNRVGLSLLDYCLLDSIYQLSTSGKERYKGWCDKSKDGFSFLASSRTIVNAYNRLVENEWLEFKNPEKRFLKRTTKKYYEEVRLYIDGVKKLHGEKVARVKKLHTKGEKVAHLGVKDLHTKGEKVAPNNNITNTITDIKDKEEPSTPKNKTSSLKKNAELEKPKKVAQKKGKEKHTFPDNTPSGYYDPLAELDCRENKQLPFMVACASKTLNKIFETKDQALKEYNQIYSEKATIEIIEKSWKSFIEKRFSNGHGQIRTVALLKDAFFKWTQHQVKFDRIDGHKKRGNEKTTSKTITTTNSMLQGTYARLRKKRGGQT